MCSISSCLQVQLFRKLHHTGDRKPDLLKPASWEEYCRVHPPKHVGEHGDKKSGDLGVKKRSVLTPTYDSHCEALHAVFIT